VQAHLSVEVLEDDVLAFVVDRPVEQVAARQRHHRPDHAQPR